MQSGRSYIKDTEDFLKKIKNLGSLPENAVLVTANVVGLHPSIPYEAGLQALEEALENRNHKQISTEKLVKMAQFVLKNKFFKFNNNVFQQISGTGIGTKFAPPYACIFMGQIENKFLRTQSHQPMVWFRYIDDIFLFGLMEKKNLKSLWQILMPLIPIFNLRMSLVKKVSPF